MAVMDRLKERADYCKHQLHALAIACRDPRVPWYAKAMVVLVVAYALSPVDLIPDFIPVLGLLDDLVILPIGIVLVLRLIPPHVLEESRAKARAEGGRNMPRNKLATGFWIFLWVLAWTAAALFCIQWLLPELNSGAIRYAKEILIPLDKPH